nr:hypothetical protein Itr_chr11CG01220 [Ipomoea trifida]
MSSAICSPSRLHDHPMMVSRPGTLSLIWSTRVEASASLSRRPSWSSVDRVLAERLVRFKGRTSSTSVSGRFSFPRRLGPRVTCRSGAAPPLAEPSKGAVSGTVMTGGSAAGLLAAFFAPKATFVLGRGAAAGAMNARSGDIPAHIIIGGASAFWSASGAFGFDELVATGADDADDSRGSGTVELASPGAGSVRGRDGAPRDGFCRPYRNSRGMAF